MNLINILVTAIIFEATGLMAAFPTMIETARKTTREGRMFDFRNMAGDQRATLLADFIERYYSDNKVVVLKMARGVLITSILSAALFLGSSYYVSSSVLPRIKNSGKQLGVSDVVLNSFEGSFNELPSICLFVACSLVVLVFLTFLMLGYYFDLPHDLKAILNPMPNQSRTNDDIHRTQ